jgi:predicted ester cyclase
MSKLPITKVATTDLSELLNPVGGQRMALPGFDAEFVDFPDYIIRITDRIWHERNVELCLKYYAPDSVIHTQGGQIIGAQIVVDNTHATLKAFPDRVLDPDNVIWSKDAPQPGSDNPVFYSSHLITSKMTNLGPSEFGDATGKKIKVITIADCACRDNVVFEEWLVRDYAAIVQQMGLDVDAKAKELAAEDVAAGFDLVAHHAANHASVLEAPVRLTDKPETPEKKPFAFAKSFFSHIWGQKNFSKLPEYYDFRVNATYPGERFFYGHDQITPLLTDLFAAIPDAQMKIEHVADIPYLETTRDIAVRWSLAGAHTGDGFYGKATGANVYIMGVSQFRVMNGRIREEVTIWDDVAVRRMIEGVRLRGE